MKKAIIFVIMLYSVSGFTQIQQDFIYSDTNTYNYTVKRAAFIFEGEVIDTSKVFWSKTLYYGRATYQSVIVKIDKIFRGNPQINEGTIELINYTPVAEPIIMTELGKEDKIVGYEDKPRYMNLTIGSKGIFFCAPLSLDTANPNQSHANSVTDNAVIVRPYSIDPQDFIYFPSYYGLLRNFGNNKKVYEYLKRFENITIPDEEIKEEK